MAKGFVKKILARLRGKPKAPSVKKRTNYGHGGGPFGHHGVAARSLKPDQQDLSEENVRQWRTLDQSEADGFLDYQEPLYVHSSNVAAIQYIPENEAMIVQYLDGRYYWYDDVTENTAIAFLQAQSKGGAVWDYFRVRGSATAHKVKYIQTTGFRPPLPRLQEED
jgi:hypothetical protein